MLDKIDYSFDVDDEKVFYAVPKRKFQNSKMSKFSFINISRYIIEKFIWKHDKPVEPKGDPIHIDKLLLEIQNFRDSVYSKLYNNFMGRRVLIPSYFNPKDLVNGYITDVSLEEGSVGDGFGNVLANSDFGVCAFDFPLDGQNRHIIESQVELDKQKWHRLNYKREYDQMDQVKRESINVTLGNVNLKKEDDIEKYLITRLHLIESGLSLIGSQYNINGGKIDILARDCKDRICIIEIKSNSKAKDIVWQCMYYPTQIKDNPNLRMITIAPGYLPSVKTVLDKIPYIEQKIFRVEKDKLIIENID